MILLKLSIIYQLNIHQLYIDVNDGYIQNNSKINFNYTTSFIVTIKKANINFTGD